MRALLAVVLLLGASCASAPAAAPASPSPAPSVPPGQTLGCTLVFSVLPAARCIDR